MRVIVYSTSTCPWCERVKDFLKEKKVKFEEKKVKFEEKNVGEDREAVEEMIEKSGQQGVPVIDVDGKIVVGFDEDKLRKLLKIK